MPLFRVTELEGGRLRPFVPASLRFGCRCGETHTGSTFALVDSGATRSAMPAAALPEHVEWDRLPRIGTRYGYGPARDVETRLWVVDVSVAGRRVADQLLVLAPDAGLDAVLLGTDSVFRHFHVAFMLAADPPVMSLEPIARSAPALAFEVPLVDPAAAIAWRERPALAAPHATAALSDGPGRPGQLAVGIGATPGPSRQARRAAARLRGR